MNDVVDAGSKCNEHAWSNTQTYRSRALDRRSDYHCLLVVVLLAEAALCRIRCLAASVRCRGESPDTVFYAAVEAIEMDGWVPSLSRISLLWASARRCRAARAHAGSMVDLPDDLSQT